MKKIFLAVLFLGISLFANETIEFEDFNTTAFSPIKDENITMGIKLSKKSRVEIVILTEDGHLIKKIESKTPLSKGSHKFQWDGRDTNKTIVPDEVYHVVLRAIDINASYDSKEFSGGEVEERIKYKVYPNGKIEYYLSKPSRVLIRVGIKNGPMLNGLSNWKPRLAGKSIQHWSGFDGDHLSKIIKRDYSVLVTAFNLPQYSIITTGNKKLTYDEYYQKREWQERSISKKQQQFERNGKRVSPHYYLSRILDKDPKVKMEFNGNIKKDDRNISIIKNGQPIEVKVVVPKNDLKYIEKIRYEVSFFIDYKFVSEEEQGYIPITWDWKPNGLSKGEHIMSVNISGFKGQVGVKSFRFLVE